MINWRSIFRVLGALQMILSAFFFINLIISFIYKNDPFPILNSGLLTLFVGLIFFFGAGKIGVGSIHKREGYLIVTLSWLIMTSFGMLPFILSNEIPQVADAFFESVSGFTTTGASILTEIEALPQDILFWRSFIQWIGGMGVIVLTVAIIPLLGIGGIELFVAEAPGPTSDKLHPRIRETAKRLWFLYLGLTIVLIFLLFIGGMSLFDAVNHSFTAMATGGYSTKNASIAAFPSAYIQYILTIFMFIAGANYTFIYFAYKRKWRSVWKMDEFRAYLYLVLFAIFLVTIQVKNITHNDWERSFRDSAFQVISVITTTGFVTADFLQWGTFAIMIFFLLLFVGGCAGSTSGGVKVIRSLVFFKNTYLEFKRILHPNAIISLKINNEIIRGKTITHIMIFLLLYIATFCVGSLIMTLLGYDFLTSIGAVATCLGNVGPGIGKVGPVFNFGWLSGEAKYLLSFLMLLGRLELFTMLVLLTPHFWRAN
jgi:trk system potassium uptake protein TrkH